MTDANTRDPKPALLFVPDISGFTQFVKATEIAHSRHIIEELLETLIESNDLGLEVSEVEGDAILFYRFGEPPTANQLFQQVRKMFVKNSLMLRVLFTLLLKKKFSTWFQACGENLKHYCHELHAAQQQESGGAVRQPAGISPSTLERKN